MSDKESNMSLGLIAGNGRFPVIFAEKAVQKGYRLYVAAYQNEAEECIKDFAHRIIWLNPGQVNKLLGFFKAEKIASVVMLGGIRKTRMFTDIRPDLGAIKLLSALKNTHDDGILRAFASLLEKEGIRVKSSTFLVPEILAPHGCLTKKKPGKSEKLDIAFGWKICREIGKLDIGQSVVVGGGTVLAVEAADGTDATIIRGGQLAKGNAVVVKLPKPDQDMRFDVPAVGPQTIETMKKAGISYLVIETGKTVCIDIDHMISLADSFGISVTAMKSGADDMPDF
jgi:DUF1009 family protein